MKSIDDLFRHYDDNEEDGIEPWDEEGHDDWTCAFPDKCLMPGEHTRSECHTAEMYEEYVRDIITEGESQLRRVA